MATNKLETRGTTGEAHADGSGSDLTLSGYTATYGTRSGNLGGFYEQIDPHCFDKALRRCDSDDPDYDEDQEDTKCVQDHDPSLLLARCSNGSLKLSTDAHGLRFVAKLNPKIQLHRDVHEAVRSGLMRSMSFAFNVPEGGDSFDEDTDEDGNRCVLRTLKNVDLAEISVLGCCPAYPGTSVDARANVVLITPAEVADKVRKIRAAAISQELAREARAQEQRIPTTDEERRKLAEEIGQKPYQEEVAAWMQPRKYPE
ncbi:MAG: HK97 family phage prohead protease [Terriglobales bacterium]